MSFRVPTLVGTKESPQKLFLLSQVVVTLGKILEACGLALTGSGLIYGLVADDLSYELTMMLAGIGVFFIGWLIDRKARK